MIARVVLVLLLAVCVVGCPSGWRLVRVEGEVGTIHPDLWDVAACTSQEIDERLEAEADTTGCAARVKPLLHCASKPNADLCRSEPDGDHRKLHDCSKLESLLSFVHLSDAQLKDHRIVMDGAVPIGVYDALTGTASRNPELERHDDAVLLATVLAANQLDRAPPLGACKAPAPPRFAIHTGDAIDAGMFSELIQFMAVMTRLKMPFFNSVGNHDNLFFGTFPVEHMRGLNVVVPSVPVVDTDRFMRFHAGDGGDFDLSLPNPSQKGEGHQPTLRGCAKRHGPICKPHLGTPKSYYQGFDLICQKPGKNGPLCPEARGYYAFDLPLPPEGKRKFRAIVLNTAEIVPTTVGEGFNRRSKGNMLPEQLRWLRDELARPADFHLVFGHHNLGLFLHDDQAEHLKKLLVETPTVLAYVTGHTHVDTLRAYPRKGGGKLWEIIAGSTLIFPQLARVVEVLEHPDGRLYMRVASFRQQLGDRPGAVSAALPIVEGAEEEEPAEEGAVPEADTTCGRLQRGTALCRQLAERAHRGRRGAENDTSDSDIRREDDAIRQANALLLVHSPNKGVAR